MLQASGDGMLAPTTQLSAREALTVARIVKVNHAGEFGAIRIYSAQIAVSRRRYPDVVPALSDMLAHEKKHCAAFLGAMPERNARPCRVMSLWSWGGWLLGFLTALMGRQAIWICTAAVEAAVHRHLDDQLHFLRERDPGLRDIILSIREEESGASASRRGAHRIRRPRQPDASSPGFARDRSGDLAFDLGRTRRAWRATCAPPQDAENGDVGRAKAIRRPR